MRALFPLQQRSEQDLIVYQAAVKLAIFAFSSKLASSYRTQSLIYPYDARLPLFPSTLMYSQEKKCSILTQNILSG